MTDDSLDDVTKVTSKSKGPWSDPLLNEVMDTLEKGAGPEKLKDLNERLGEKIKALKEEAAARKRRKSKSALIQLTIAFVLLVPAMFWHGYVLANLWNLFVGPYAGFPINAAYGFGWLLVFRFAFPTNLALNDGFTDAKRPFVKYISSQWLYPLVALGFGHFWHWLAF